MQGAYQGWAIGKMDERYAARSNALAYGGDGGKTIFFIRPVFDDELNTLEKNCPCQFENGWYFHPDISRLDLENWITDRAGNKIENPNYEHPIYVRDMQTNHPMGRKKYYWKIKERFFSDLKYFHLIHFFPPLNTPYDEIITYDINFFL